jgi:Ca2+-binding RTX toxin-like protein
MANIINGTSASERLDGTAGDDEIYGFGGDDQLFGLGGRDVLDGGIGADEMTGGTGDDSYFVDDAGDVIFENTGEGRDDVTTSLSTYTLGDNVEIVAGDASDQTLIGNALDNIIHGVGGADLMIGGLGNDYYSIDNAGDVVVENAGEGIDTIYSAIGSYSIAALSNVENLQGTWDSDDTLTGNGNDNVINGWTGADTMFGGRGNDTYYVDDAGDTIGELAGEGSDTLIASVDYVLNAGANVELMRIEGGAYSTRSVDLTGNDLAQTIYGNAAGNVLNGAGGDDYLLGLNGSDTLDGGSGNDILRGGNGDDTLTGGAGNDILSGEVGADVMAGQSGNDRYNVDSALDIVTEAAGEGTDTVVSSVSYTLSANAEIEVMRTSTHSTGSIDFTGNDYGQRMDGNDGSNLLNGGGGADYLVGHAGDDILNGGAGFDVLRGGLGSDQFRFDTLDGRDNIADFAVGEDSIFLDQSAFDVFGSTGMLAADEFAAGGRAQDANDHIIYNQEKGYIYYDADGSGPEAQQYFAHVAPGTELTHSDFFIG